MELVGHVAFWLIFPFGGIALCLWWITESRQSSGVVLATNLGFIFTYLPAISYLYLVEEEKERQAMMSYLSVDGEAKFSMLMIGIFFLAFCSLIGLSIYLERLFIVAESEKCLFMGIIDLL